jgi:hypothetical protein
LEGNKAADFPESIQFVSVLNTEHCIELSRLVTGSYDFVRLRLH